jgi:hypothetical protein
MSEAPAAPAAPPCGEPELPDVLLLPAAVWPALPAVLAPPPPVPAALLASPACELLVPAVAVPPALVLESLELLQAGKLANSSGPDVMATTRTRRSKRW